MTIAVISMIRDSWGGSEELWYQMANEALQQGHRVIHLGFEHPVIHPKMEELQNMGLERFTRPGWVPPEAGNKKIFYLGWNFVRKRIKDPLSKIFKLAPDIIVYNGTCYSIAAEKSLVNYVAQINNRSKFFILGHLNNQFDRCITETEAQVIRKAYQLARNVFFVSQRNLDTAKRHLCSPINNGEIVQNPVNMASVDPIAFPAIAKAVQLALVGNLVASHKGQDILFHTLALWQQDNWHLNIYGKGPDLFYLKNLASFLGIQNKISFHGSVSNIRMIWEQNHILLMPSLLEGMPLAVVEAMLCRRFCIATDVGGHKEWIQHGVNGFIAAAPTIASLRQALDQAWAVREKWQIIAEQARQTAMDRFDPNAGATFLRRIIAE
ncbi:MAG: glycosyltransferase [Chitinophagaceae bacterium]|nr:MAG: glycosyltransferase [Chitinophagaceae bacterium]